VSHFFIWRVILVLRQLPDFFSNGRPNGVPFTISLGYPFQQIPLSPVGLGWGDIVHAAQWLSDVFCLPVLPSASGFFLYYEFLFPELLGFFFLPFQVCPPFFGHRSPLF